MQNSCVGLVRGCLSVTMDFSFACRRFVECCVNLKCLKRVNAVRMGWQSVQLKSLAATVNLWTWIAFFSECSFWHRLDFSIRRGLWNHLSRGRAHTRAISNNVYHMDIYNFIWNIYKCVEHAVPYNWWSELGTHNPFHYHECVEHVYTLFSIYLWQMQSTFRATHNTNMTFISRLEIMF